MYRIVSVLIVIFWLTMTALLLRNEIKPGDSALREVPPGHVVKLLLLHQQSSDLNIVSEKIRIGRLRIEPRTDKEQGLRSIGYSGNLILTIPGGGGRQRVAWDGVVEMNKELTVQCFRLGVTAHEPEKLRSEITVRPAEKTAHFELSSANGVLERQTYSLDERGAKDVFRQLGVDPAMLPISSIQQSQVPILKAQQSSLEIHGERMDTYLVTLESNGQTWMECHVNQLGQIVQATTLLGYTLVPDDITP